MAITKNDAEIIWNARPHIVKFLRLFLIYSILANFFISFFAIAFIEHLWAYFIATFILELLIGIYTYYLWKTIKYRFDDEGLKCNAGIIYKVRKFVPLYKITNYSDTQGLIQQWLKISTIGIHTAGMGSNYPELIFSDLKSEDAEKLMNLLKKNVRKIYKDRFGE